MYRVAVLHWERDDGIAQMLTFELSSIGHTPAPFVAGDAVPRDCDVLLTHGPHGKLIPVWEEAALKGCVTAHWNTEGMPDPRTPASLSRLAARLRSFAGRLADSDVPLHRRIGSEGPVAWFDSWMHRHRYCGDYAYGIRKGCLDVLGDSSIIYGRSRERSGIPTLYVPWGSTAVWRREMNLERDLDVLWIGKRGSRRRSRLLDVCFQDLRRRGIRIHVADNEENPFLFDDKRTEYLNRAKVTLNFTRTWFDDNFSRFSLAAANRSLIVSEHVLPHCPEFKPGVHYVAAAPHEVASTVARYLDDGAERERIVENAYKLIMGDLRFEHGLRRLLGAVERTKKGTQAIRSNWPESSGTGPVAARNHLAESHL